MWSSDAQDALAYPARHLFRFLDHHGMLTVTGSPTWRTVVGGSRTYVERLAAITLHIACSLLVLAGIVHGRKLAGWASAVLLHGTFNLVAVLMVGAGIDLVLVEVVLVALAIGLWVGIMKSRPLFPTEIAAPSAPGSEVPPAPRVG